MKWDLCRLKFDNVSIIVIDSKTLIDTVQNFNTPSPSFGSLDSDDIKSTLKLLSCLDFAFVSKDVNILIHNLALWIAFLYLEWVFYHLLPSILILMACLEVKKRRGSKVKGGRIIQLPYLKFF